MYLLSYLCYGHLWKEAFELTELNCVIRLCILYVYYFNIFYAFNLVHVLHCCVYTVEIKSNHIKSSMIRKAPFFFLSYLYLQSFQLATNSPNRSSFWDNKFQLLPTVLLNTLMLYILSVRTIRIIVLRNIYSSPRNTL